MTRPQQCGRLTCLPAADTDATGWHCCIHHVVHRGNWVMATSVLTGVLMSQPQVTHTPVCVHAVLIYSWARGKRALGALHTLPGRPKPRVLRYVFRTGALIGKEAALHDYSAKPACMLWRLPGVPQDGIAPESYVPRVVCHRLGCACQAAGQAAGEGGAEVGVHAA
jgi:hypothetical protein